MIPLTVAESGADLTLQSWNIPQMENMQYSTQIELQSPLLLNMFIGFEE